MKKFKLFALSALAAFTMASCGDDEVVPEVTSDVTWTKDNIYRLDGRVFVENNATLTIEAGTIIKASPGQAAFSSALIITRSGMINAQGTAAEPIIFTSSADAIEPGMITSPNMDPSTRGLWGGVIILGEAPISAQNDNDQDVAELQIEGVPTSEDALYGGNNDADNSGTLSYVSIRQREGYNT